MGSAGEEGEKDEGKELALASEPCTDPTETYKTPTSSAGAKVPRKLICYNIMLVKSVMPMMP